MRKNSITFDELFEIVRKRIWIVLLIPIIFVSVSGYVSYKYMTPIYAVSTQLLVISKEKEGTEMTFNDIQTSLKLIDTYSIIIQNPGVLNRVIKNLNLNLSANQLNDKIIVNPITNSQIISISVTDPDPEMAVKLANGIAKAFIEEISIVMNVHNVKILTEAKADKTMPPISPKPLMNMAVAFVISLFISTASLFILEFFRKGKNKINEAGQFPNTF
ncbi:YveK family protein [Aneurinibacillus migulanus]|uniref:Capsular polysaccharide biosynthesis protein n=1 Tax=Aneurinibacillus migulanus TaxID=47500 RepID=A0A1G9ABX6_ANEMI|nr:Wzz/FepE/Etk N-terminal domain-containing protein [Aneurinibacillus migulanus]MED0896630.1 Wzz/FepE/Etk N-terminal domain-containing protein [Aneurinibacillus migulanus]MED1616009.1 Wzz/FepE/Etk N-terminal domain-containing protein [Aneurinibacillus migulanus]GED15976.1 putative capsular polysaccharide biosynthesis protein YwqC [Aneurinibacillus migulanus]SDK24743.1 Capsular polysaccharide biosynthesis protein [Aneurinibacillus migulanus]